MSSRSPRSSRFCRRHSKWSTLPLSNNAIATAGPAATLLVVGIEYVKGLLPWRWWRGGAHFALGWLLFPLRYLVLPLLGTARAGRIRNHCYLWLHKPARR
jgi:hypothetical protein